jgi:hypothetical protein
VRAVAGIGAGGVVSRRAAVSGGAGGAGRGERGRGRRFGRGVAAERALVGEAVRQSAPVAKTISKVIRDTPYAS